MNSYISRMFLSLFLLFCFCYKSYPQKKDLSPKEERLIKLYAKFSDNPNADYDSIEFYSDEFSRKIKQFLDTNPATLTYSFKAFNSYCGLERSSADGRFRIYSWDTRTGGTMHIFHQIYQYKSNGKTFIKEPQYEEGDPGSYCSEIYTVDINAKRYYLEISNGIYSTKDAGQSISVHAIEKDQLTDTARLFKTKKDILNRVDIMFNFFSVAHRPERPLQLITYDSARKIIYIPVVNKNNEVTDKNILYQLTDKWFEFIGIETGKRE